ncbi:MAG: methyltransferase domain-containing protein [Nocardiopsaceae bacterium]|jgi:SAM-dependent methyltransferase|nr:methyltransferase domain-containing protein [Nocardiopsaceae bacterium]
MPPEQGMDAGAVYALGSSEGETARLKRQADELTPDSHALLDRVGLLPGQRVIDLGCGPRGTLELLAERVSPGGQVVGVDADPGHTAMAAEYAAACGLTGVEVITADARRTGLASGSFDLVHTRAVLINVPEPEQVVAEMVRLARPGGWVVAMEPDTEYALCYPPDPAFTRLCEIFPVVASHTGADPHVGRRVPELFRHAGLQDIAVDATARVYPPGNSRRTLRLDLLRAMRPRVLELGLASETELDELDAAARAHLGNSDTIVMPDLFFLVSARKPVV